MKNDPAEQREFPSGPIGITKIEKVGASLKLTLLGTDVQAGDMISVELTGNTSINGQYRVDSTMGSDILVRSPDIELGVAILNRGQVRITAGGD